MFGNRMNGLLGVLLVACGGGGRAVTLEHRAAGGPLAAWKRCTGNVSIRALAVRPAAGVVVAGSLVQGADLGGGPIAPTGGQFDVRDDGFVASYDDHNVLDWVHLIATTGDDVVVGVGVAADGSVVIAGTQADGSVDLGAGPVAGAGHRDAFVAAYEHDGKLRWVHRFATAAPDEILAMALDASTGKLAVVGAFGDGIVLDGGRARPAGDYVVELSPAGEPLWAHELFASHAGGRVGSMVVDRTGAITVAGYGTAPIDVGDGDHAAGSELFVVHLSAAGQLAWSKHLATAGGGMGPAALAIGDDARIYLAGGFQGTVDFGARSLRARQQDAFVAAYSSDGQPLWAQQLVGNYDTFASGIAVDRAGNVAVVGRYAVHIELAGLRATTEPDGDGDHASFVAKLAADGTPRWLVDNGRQRVDAAPVVTMDRSGQPIVGFEHEGETCIARSPIWAR